MVRLHNQPSESKMQSKRITILCLLAAGAMSAATAQSASAALPEFVVANYFCENTTMPPSNQIGQFENAAECQDPTLPNQMKGKWWRLPPRGTGVNSTEFEIHSNVGTPHLNIICKTAKSKGEFPELKSEARFSEELKTCKFEGTTCTSPGLPEGVIVTNNLHGPLGYVKKPSSGIAFSSESGPIAVFSCTLIGEITLEGCVIGEALPLNSMGHAGELIFAENSEKTGQKWTKLEGGSECPLTIKSKGSSGKAWLTGTEKLEYSVEMEIKA